MRQLSSILLLACLVWAGPVQAQYLSAAPDIPLAEGLQEIAEGTLVFDKPQGRILQMTAARDAGSNLAAARQFYRASLPNLGWTPRAGKDNNILTFTRKSETLRLTFSADLVIFDLTPEAPIED
ncbi:MAG: hypothetical protein HN715_04935 [Rhodobiaceae bacterium]|jgi:hypothetical protein|nr:hypothetical protein [Rhodobiaceae bacterium]